MSILTTDQINHYIAIKINGWVHDESIFYHDASGTTQYLADYCHSIAHALDLAKTAEVGLTPVEDGWTAYSVANPDVSETDALSGVAICLCVLKIFDTAEVVTSETEPVI